MIAKKGATYYAIGLAITQVVKAILADRNDVFPVSTLISNYYSVNNVCLSIPCVINRKGIERTIELTLNKQEQALLRRSAKTLSKYIKKLG